MPNEDSVSRIDPVTHTVQQTIPVGNGPAAIAVGDGFVWVANSLGGTVWQIDPRKNGGQAVKRIAVGNGPTGIAYGLGGVWVANSIDRTVVRIDPRSGAPGKPISVNDGADALAVGDGAIWVAGQSTGVLSRVDPRDQQRHDDQRRQCPRRARRRPRVGMGREQPGRNRLAGRSGDQPGRCSDPGRRGTRRRGDRREHERGLGLERARRHALAQSIRQARGPSRPSRSAISRTVSPSAATPPSSPFKARGPRIAAAPSRWR